MLFSIWNVYLVHVDQYVTATVVWHHVALHQYFYNITYDEYNKAKEKAKKKQWKHECVVKEYFRDQLISIPYIIVIYSFFFYFFCAHQWSVLVCDGYYFMRLDVKAYCLHITCRISWFMHFHDIQIPLFRHSLRFSHSTLYNMQCLVLQMLEIALVPKLK